MRRGANGWVGVWKVIYIERENNARVVARFFLSLASHYSNRPAGVYLYTHIYFPATHYSRNTEIPSTKQVWRLFISGREREFLDYLITLPRGSSLINFLK